MAPVVKKSAKINFYKFVNLPKTGSTAISKESKGRVAITSSLNANVKALNNVGATLNSIAKALQEFVDSQQQILQNISTTTEPSFVPRYTKPKGQEDDDGGLVDNEIAEVKMPGFLESLFNIVKDFLTLAIAKPVLEWLSDPENRETVKRVVGVIVDVFKAVSEFLTDRIVGLIDNLYELFREDKDWTEKIGDFFGAIVNFAGLFVAIRYLKNPLKLIGDFKDVLKGLFGGLRGAKKSLRGTLKRLGKAGMLVGAGLLLYNALTGEDGDDGADGDPGQDGANADTSSIEDALGEFAKGGPFGKYAKGGWISGPQSGYPVSLDGGKSASFIGHGTEYVASRAAGGFVIPFDTPATKSNPGLTQQRIGEAQGMGFDLGGMLKGFAAGGPTNQTSTERSTNRGTDRRDKGGGQKAVIGVGKAILKKGFTVAEHPNFTKNNYSGTGANTGKGFNPAGNSRVGGHSSGSAHYKNLAIDVTDWRSGDWAGRTKKLAQKVYENRKKFRLTQIIHDPWGSWFAGGSKGGGIGGHGTHLHLAFADAVIKGGGRRQPSNNGSGSAPADSKIVQSMGFNKQQWDIFRHTVAKIESGGKYDIAGGSGGHYDGRYQLGAAAKTDGARYAGISDPGHGAAAREKFRKDPKLQETLFAGFTKANHTYLMGNAQYKAASPERKLQILGYAHNQGMGGAETWMTTGVVGADGFGTKGTKYTDEIAKAFKNKGSSGVSGLDGEDYSDLDPDMGGDVALDDSGDDSTPAFQFSQDPAVAFQQLANQFKDLFSDGAATVVSSTTQQGDTTGNITPVTVNSGTDVVKGTNDVNTAKAVKQTQTAEAMQQMQAVAAAQNAQTQAVAKQNLEQVAAAQNASQQQKPQIIPTGGVSKTALVAQLNSSNNPLKVF